MGDPKKSILLLLWILSFSIAFSIAIFLKSDIIWNESIITIEKEGIRTELEITPNNTTEIAFLWDVMIGAWIGDIINKKGAEFVFWGTKEFLSKKDAVVLNLETPVTNGSNFFPKKYTFKADKKHLKYLKEFNENLTANLANNHIGDYRDEWITDTLQALTDEGIQYFGAGKNKIAADWVKIISVDDLKIGLIGQVCIWPIQFIATEWKPWNSFFNKDVIEKQIAKAKKQNVDLIVYNMHCWDEYKNGPNAKQIDYAHFAIDAWVDLVIGHHPHWYQPIEKYKGKYIFYSLGDYIFDINDSRRTQDGIIANIIIHDKKIVKAEIIPVRSKVSWNTEFPDEKYTKFILDEIYNISKKINKIPSISKWYIK